MKITNATDAKFTKLASRTNHQYYLDLARKIAAVSCPELFPPYSNGAPVALVYPQNGHLPKAINTAAGSMTETTVPSSGVSMFQINPDELAMDEVLKEMLTAGNAAVQNGQDPLEVQAFINDNLSKISVSLAKSEKVIAEDIAASTLRSKVHQGYLQVIAGGNCLLEVVDVAPLVTKLHNLLNFTKQLDGVGNLLKLIVREAIAFEALPENVQTQLSSHFLTKGHKEEDWLDDDLTIYTFAELKNGKYKVWKEIDGLTLDGTEASYLKGELPFVDIYVKRIEGEHYGRPFVEAIIGSFVTAEELQKSVRNNAAMAARHVLAARPGTNPRVIKEAKNGAVITANADDIKPIQYGRGFDMQFVALEKEKVEALIAEYCLGTEFRQGERVTAEEIKMKANAQNLNHGGVFNLLSDTFQKPTINCIIAFYRRKGLLSLDKSIVSIKVTTGIDAIGRGMDYTRLMSFINAIIPLTKSLDNVINIDTLISRMAVGLAIDPVGLVKTREQIKAELERRQQQEMAQQAAPQMMGAAFQAGAQGGAPQAPQPQGA